MSPQVGELARTPSPSETVESKFPEMFSVSNVMACVAEAAVKPAATATMRNDESSGFFMMLVFL